MFTGRHPLVDILAGLLRSNGIECAVFEEVVSRVYLGYLGAHRLMVRARDEEAALKVMAEAEPLAEDRGTDG